VIAFDDDVGIDIDPGNADSITIDLVVGDVPSRLNSYTIGVDHIVANGSTAIDAMHVIVINLVVSNQDGSGRLDTILVAMHGVIENLRIGALSRDAQPASMDLVIGHHAFTADS